MSEFLLSRTDRKYHSADMSFLMKNSSKLIDSFPHAFIPRWRLPGIHPKVHLNLRKPFSDIDWCERRGATTHSVRGEEQKIKFTYDLIWLDPPPQKNTKKNTIFAAFLELECEEW